MTDPERGDTVRTAASAEVTLMDFIVLALFFLGGGALAVSVFSGLPFLPRMVVWFAGFACVMFGWAGTYE